MVNRSKSLAVGIIALASSIALPSAVPSTQAAPPKPPPPFPPVAGCGTIDGIEYEDLEGNIVVCLVWLRDQGGTYRFNGIEDYSVGDRVFVQGVACTICTPFCGGAVPILNSTDFPCS